MIEEKTITLRPITASEGPAIAALSAASADGGRIRFTPVYQVDPWRALQALHPDLLGVAAWSADCDSPVGIGLIQFGQCQYEGLLRPYALLNTLIVHPAYRRRGIASRLAQWRIEQVRQRYGDNVVLLANIQSGNSASERTAARWLKQTAGPLTYLPLKTRAAPPRPLPGVRVRVLRPAEYGLFAEALNHFYADTNLFSPESAESLAHWVQTTPLDTPIRSLLVAVDAQDRPLAGMAVNEDFRLRQVRLVKMPLSIRLINQVLRLIPSDGIMREASASRIWRLPGQEQAPVTWWTAPCTSGMTRPPAWPFLLMRAARWAGSSPHPPSSPPRSSTLPSTGPSRSPLSGRFARFFDHSSRALGSHSA